MGKIAELKIAFASRDGKTVTDHFGFAEEYIVNGEVRKVTAPRKSENPHLSFAGIIDILDDCDAIVAAKFGEAAVEYIKSRGIRIFQAEGNIDGVQKEIVRKWAR
jgi:predicted Fe-Mo cluster-binding NifX family protein